MDIKELLDKYYSGESSLAEDEYLKRYFSQPGVAKEFEADKEIFNYTSNSLNGNLSDKKFDLMIENASKSNVVKVNFFKKATYTISSIAAALLIYFGVNSYSGSDFADSTVDNPQEALVETLKAFSIVSESMDKSVLSLNKMKNLKNFKSLDLSIEDLRSLGVIKSVNDDVQTN